ncbi:MAG: hypothetical protein R3A79_17815 [Nannocystaceae bacterium]
MPTRKLVFNVAPEGRPTSPLDVTGYLFDARGALLASAPVSDGRLVVEADARRLVRATLYLAPTSAEVGRPSIAAMRRVGAYSPAVALRPDAAITVKIPEDLWRRWLFCVTRVVGRVVRPVELGGEIHELGVCEARVHVCEVDPFPRIFERLPDVQILRIRDELLRLVEPPRIRLPRPIPDPTPLRLPRLDARLVTELRAEPATIRVGAVEAAASASEPFAAMMSPAETRLLREARALAGGELAAASARVELPTALRNALAGSAPAPLRAALIANTEVLMPILCVWPWIWRFVRYDEIKVVTTDAHGRFEALVLYPCDGDKPDIYCWVEYAIGGSWTPVLKPPAACATRWNYASGEEIILRVRDARVPWCEAPPTLPGKRVGVLTLGRSISVHQVDQSTGLAPGGRPLGGSVEPSVWFGEDLQQGDGATHYKWSYRRLAADLTPVEGWIAADERIVARHYGVIDGGGVIHFKSHKLGPDEAITDDSLFQIPPRDPPAGSWAPQLNPRDNAASAYVLSGSRTEHQRLPNGPYELKLELFDASGGAPVRVTGVDFQIPPADVAAPFDTGDELTLVPAPASYLIEEAGEVVGFRMIVRIDNGACTAMIHPTEVPGGAEECGFITFDAPTTSATLRFTAAHDNDYATFAFSLVRGRCAVTSAAAAGTVGSTPEDGYALDVAGAYARALAISTLLAPLPPLCPDGCRNGAFAEHLHVYALATDGWGRLTYLDAHAVAAFALAHS